MLKEGCMIEGISLWKRTCGDRRGKKVRRERKKNFKAELEVQEIKNI